MWRSIVMRVKPCMHALHQSHLRMDEIFLNTYFIVVVFVQEFVQVFLCFIWYPWSCCLNALWKPWLCIFRAGTYMQPHLGKRSSILHLPNYSLLTHSHTHTHRTTLLVSQTNWHELKLSSRNWRKKTSFVQCWRCGVRMVSGSYVNHLLVKPSGLN